MSARFVFERELGRGASGIVHAAIDRTTGARVAVKTLRSGHPDAVHRLRRECAALRALAHPNLVAVGELIEDGGAWRLTMELIDGVDLRQALRPRDPPRDAPVDVARVRRLFAQLASGVAALHASGRVHRDLKPGNVLVEGERVVIVDLGLATADTEATGELVGTAAYMAPEQADGQASPAADWYAVGAMLYEVLTGAVPIAGDGLDAIVAKQTAPPRPARARAPWVPRDLDDLCAALLAVEPAARPDDAAVLAALAGDTPVRASAPPFVGRTAALAALAAAHDDVREGAPIAAVIDGEIGIGKSALVAAFAAAVVAARPDALVLVGQCRERDAVPFKGLDEVVDALVAHLRTWPAVEVARLVPARAGLLLAAFPALRRLDAFARAPRPALGDPIERRRLTFAAARALFVALAERCPVVIALDDAQWADADTRALLAEIVRPPDGPRVLLVIAGAGTGPELPCATRRLVLGPLDDAEAAALVAALAARRGGPLDDALARAIVREAEGRPMFLDELVRYAGGPGPVRLDEALRARVAALAPEARGLVALLAVAGAPLATATAARAVGLGFGPFARLTASLRAAGLIRVGEPLVLAHERVRQAALAALDAAARRAQHAALAAALSADPTPDLATLAFHLHAAGQLRDAREVAERAASQAEAALAFAHAASLLALALATGPAPDEARALELRRGDALAAAGRGADAAAAFLRAATDAPPSLALELRRRAAVQLLMAGYIDRGIGEVRAVLAAAGLRYPTSPRRALARLIWQRARLRLARGYQLRPRGEISPRELAQVDLCWTVGVALSTVDTIRGNLFNALGVRLALRSGDAYRVSRARAIEAGMLATVGVAQRARVDAAIAEAKALAERADDPHARAFARALDGQCALMRGDFPAAHAICVDAERRLREECVGAVREIATMRVWIARAMQYMGDAAALAAWLPDVVRECRERGDRYAETTLRASVMPFVRLCADDPEGARRECAQARATWTTAEFHVPHYFAAMADLAASSYGGDHARAVAQARALWPVLERTLLVRVQLVRTAAQDAIARALLAAHAHGAASAGDLRWARRLARALGRDRMAWSAPLAATLDAALLAPHDPVAAAGTLERAATGFTGAAMALHARAAIAVATALAGRDPAPALAEVAALGVRDPARVVAWLVPVARGGALPAG